MNAFLMPRGPGRRAVRRVALALVAFAPGFVVPSLARALSVDRAVVKVNPKKGDGFVLQGQLAGLSLDGAEAIAVVFGSFTEEVPRASFGAKGQKLVYKAPTARGLRTLVLDSTKQRFLAVGKGVTLVPFHNPAAVRLGTGASRSCTMIRLTGGPKQWRLSGTAGGGACVLETPPELTPAGFLIQTATSVRVLAAVAPDAALDGGSAALVRVDASLVASGNPICTLRDDGHTAGGDDTARDGFYGCIANFNEPAPAHIGLAVQASVAGAPAISPSAVLDVVAPLTDEEINVGIAAQEMAGTAWDESTARLGDSVRARKAAVARIKRLPGVAAAGITPDGYSIWIRYESGVEGGLNLDPPGTPGTGPVPMDTASAAIGESRTGPMRVAAGRALPSVAPRIGNHKVLVWDPWADESVGDVGLLLQTLQSSQCPKFEVTHLRNEECTVDSIRTFPSYGTVILLTHGAVLPDRVVAFMSREKADLFSEWFTYREDLKLGRLLVYKGQRSPAKHGYLVFRPTFIQGLPGRFPNSVVFAGACLSAANPTMANVVLGKGAKAYYGMSQTTYASFNRWTAYDLFDNLVKGPRNARDAADRLIHKSDRSFLAAFGSSLKPLDAEVRLLLGDGRLAYSCAPPVEELLDTLTVAFGGEQTGVTNLRSDITYRLVVTGTATETTSEGSNEFDAFYCFGGFCSVGPFSDPRLIGVGVIVDGGDSSFAALSGAIEGDYPPYEGSHRYEVFYRPPLSGPMTVRSPHDSEGPFNTAGSFTIEVFGPR